MNLMFRKNFRADAKERSFVPSGGKASSGGGRLRLRGASRSDSTTTGYTVMDDHHYRCVGADD
jgi:hypothetical protein